MNFILKGLRLLTISLFFLLIHVSLMLLGFASLFTSFSFIYNITPFISLAMLFYFFKITKHVHKFNKIGGFYAKR